MKHISFEDLECYHLGMVKAESELALLEEHLLACSECASTAQNAADYVDRVREALIRLTSTCSSI